MHCPRCAHTASLLTNGKVLVTGARRDDCQNSTELYDPSTGIWIASNSMKSARWWHTASVLKNGKVLITGGYVNNSIVLNSTELYDPSTGIWSITDDMNNARGAHTASILTNEKVLVAGGNDGDKSLISAELY